MDTPTEGHAFFDLKMFAAEDSVDNDAISVGAEVEVGGVEAVGGLLCVLNEDAVVVVDGIIEAGPVKPLQRGAGLKKKLHLHMTRHTFATTVTLSNGVPIESVSRMLGHASIKQTQHYARVVADKIKLDMASLKDVFCKSKLIQEDRCCTSTWQP